MKLSSKAQATSTKKQPKRRAPSSVRYQKLVPDANNPKHDRVFRFVDEYLIDSNGAAAARRAGYSEKSGRQTASQLLSNAHIMALIEEKKRAFAVKNEITREYMVQRFLKIVNHDLRELTELYVHCCRHCHGSEFTYQETQYEHHKREQNFKSESSRYERLTTANPRSTAKPPIWNDAIELGFDRKEPPNPNCPECGGKGSPQVVFNDTRNLSESSGYALQSIKRSRHGIDVKTYDKNKSLDGLNKMCGFYNQENKPEGDITLDPVALEEKYITRIKKAEQNQADVNNERNLKEDL